jgi:hypothetical protein
VEYSGNWLGQKDGLPITLNIYLPDEKTAVLAANARVPAPTRTMTFFWPARRPTERSIS